MVVEVCPQGTAWSGTSAPSNPPRACERVDYQTRVLPAGWHPQVRTRDLLTADPSACLAWSVNDRKVIMSERRKPRDRCELVWSERLDGVAETAGGTIGVGVHGEWTPAQILSTAVQTSLMIEFMRLARESGLEIRGYRSTAIARGRELDRIAVSPCIDLARERDRRQALVVLGSARERSVLCRILRERVVVDPCCTVSTEESV